MLEADADELLDTVLGGGHRLLESDLDSQLLDQLMLVRVAAEVVEGHDETLDVPGGVDRPLGGEEHQLLLKTGRGGPIGVVEDDVPPDGVDDVSAIADVVGVTEVTPSDDALGISMLCRMLRGDVADTPTDLVVTHTTSMVQVDGKEHSRLGPPTHSTTTP